MPYSLVSFLKISKYIRNIRKLGPIMFHAHVELYLLQGLYVPCPCGTLFIAGVICPMPGMGHITPAINKVPHRHGTYSPCNK
jgi:hypothetical protein